MPPVATRLMLATLILVSLLPLAQAGPIPDMVDGPSGITLDVTTPSSPALDILQRVTGPFLNAPPMTCGPAVTPVCNLLNATPCAGINPNANLRVDPGFLIYVQVGFGGPGPYGGYSEACN